MVERRHRATGEAAKLGEEAGLEEMGITQLLRVRAKPKPGLPMSAPLLCSVLVHPLEGVRKKSR